MKKILLTLVPALMLLGSCAGAQPQVQNGLFHEDTLAHEEIFGSVQDGLKKVRKNAINPGYPDVPTIGVQTKESDGNISIRFIAAVKLGNLRYTSAVWTRAMYDNVGNPFAVKGKTTAEIECTKAYTSVYANGAEYDMSDFDKQQELTEPSGYTHFVVYTMLNIPKSTYKDYFLNAYLTLNGKTTNMRATSVDGSKDYLLPANQTGYFLAGTIGGVKDSVIVQDDYLRGPNPSSYTVTFAGDLAAGDRFTMLNVTSKFEVVKPEVSGDISEESFSINATTGLITVNTDKTDHYAMFLTNDGKLEADHKYDIKINLTLGESGKTVSIPGSLNGWSTSTNMLTEIGSTKVYTTLLRRNRGEDFEFKFYVDGYSDDGWEDTSNRTISVTKDLSRNYTYEKGYVADCYLVGKIQGGEEDWSTLHDEYHLSYAKIGSTEVNQISIDLNKGDLFQVLCVLDTGAKEWKHPYGSESYEVTATGNYTVYYFEGWDNIDVVSEYFLVGDFNEWKEQDADYKLTQTGFKTYIIEGVTLAGESNIKVISTNNIWYGNNDIDEGDDWNVWVEDSGIYNVEFSVVGVDHISLDKIWSVPEE